MKKFKRLVCLIFVFLFTASIIAGCALVERDIDHFNNLTVATIGSDIRIRKGQLVAAFNNNGHQYMQQGMTTREAVERTLDELIDREIMAELSMQEFSYHLTPSQIRDLREARGTGRESVYYRALYENEKAEVRKDVFDALDDFYVQLQNRVRSERNLTVGTHGSGEDPNLATPSPVVEAFRPHQPLVRRNDGGMGVAANTIFTMDISSHTNREFLVGNVPTQWSPDIDASARGTDITEVVKTEALVRLVRILTNNERGTTRGRDTSAADLVEDVKVRGNSVLDDSERALIGRELARMIEEQSKTVLARRYQDIFDLGITEPIDRSMFPRAEDFEAMILDKIRATGGHRRECYIGRHLSTCKGFDHMNIERHPSPRCSGCAPHPNCSGCEDVRQVRASNLARQAEIFYRSQILSQYNRFVRGQDTMTSLSEGALDGLNSTFWLPTEVAQNHFTVSHILIQYDDNQTAEFERIKSEFQQGGFVTAENYNARMQALAGNLTVRARDENGVEHGEAKTALQVRDEIIAAIGGTPVNVAQPGGNFVMMAPAVSTVAEEQRRINIFRDFIYKYNQDPGMMNAEFEYVIGVDNSRMVAEFTAASRELYGYRQVARKQGNEYIYDHEGNLHVEWERNPGFTPQRSSMTFDLVMTSFGAHIVMYTRPLTDFIYNTCTRGITRADGSIDLRLVDYPSFERGVNTMLANLSGTNFLYAPLNSYGNQFGQYLFAAGKQSIEAPAKTWFDIAVERMHQPAFDNMRSNLIVNYRNARIGGNPDGRLANPIRLYRSNFRDMWR